MSAAVVIIVLLAGLLAVVPVDAFVIAPPWANSVSNPCSARSWQLIYWPKDGKCYPIFSQGPCPRSQELAFNDLTKLAECRCPKQLLYWPATDRCYPEFSKGPCEPGQFLERLLGRDAEVAVKKAERGHEGESRPHHHLPRGSQVRCRMVERCDNGWIFWPSEGKCFQLYTQGPCHKGDLLIMNPLTAEPYCGCDPLLLRQYYFPPLNLCYEHFTQGPCEVGLVFSYNHTSQSTHCMCAGGMVNTHAESGRCFQFGTKGPCKKGQVFSLSGSTGACVCKDNYVLWPENGECYKAFTPSPCRPEEFIIPKREEDRGGGREIRDGGSVVGACVKNPCPRAHLYFPDGSDGGKSVKCHKVGSRGPCPLGELVVFEKYSGKSYRGECGCSPGYNQNYWPPTRMCYEWYSQGPCGDSFLFRFNKDTGKTECVCDEDEGYVFWNETKKCYRVYTKGPCPAHAWLIPSEEEKADGKKEVFCECRTGYHFDPDSYTCKRSIFALPELLYGGDEPSATWAHLSLMDRLRRRQQQEQRRRGRPPEVNWTRGVFVSTATTPVPHPLRPKIPPAAPATAASGAATTSEPVYAWGAKALPRVGRTLISGGDGAVQRRRNVRTGILGRRRVLRN